MTATSMCSNFGSKWCSPRLEVQIGLFKIGREKEKKLLRLILVVKLKP